MKKSLAILSSCIVCAANAADVTPAASVDDFLWSIGACSSISRRGETLDGTIANLKYTGIRWLRSGFEDGVPMEDFIALHNATGVKFSYGLLSGSSDLDRLFRGATVLADIGALLALEGSNEPNNFGPIRYGGEEGGQMRSWLPVAKLHRDLYARAKADPVLKDYPVWGPCEPGAQIDNCGLQFLTIPEGANTLMPDGTKYADFATVHNYLYLADANFVGLHDNLTWTASSPNFGNPLNGLCHHFGVTWLKKFPGYSAEQLKTLPRVTTEIGIQAGHYGVTEEDQARLYLNMFLSQFAQGWSHTGMYLFKGRADEPHYETFALFKLDYTPKQAAHYLHNFTTILDDRQPVAELKPLNYTVELPPTSHQLLLQRSNGNHVLILWGERYKSGGSDDVVVKLGNKAKAIHVYDPTKGTWPQKLLANADTIPLSLTNHPFILEIIK